VSRCGASRTGGRRGVFVAGGFDRRGALPPAERSKVCACLVTYNGASFRPSPSGASLSASGLLRFPHHVGTFASPHRRLGLRRRAQGRRGAPSASTAPTNSTAWMGFMAGAACGTLIARPLRERSRRSCATASRTSVNLERCSLQRVRRPVGGAPVPDSGAPAVAIRPAITYRGIPQARSARCSGNARPA
jgi:hypothetical protein